MNSFGDIRWEANNKLFAKFSPFIEFHHFYMNANFISLQPFTFSHRQGFCDYKFSHSTFSTMRLLKLGKTFPRRNAKKPDIDLECRKFRKFSLRRVHHYRQFKLKIVFADLHYSFESSTHADAAHSNISSIYENQAFHSDNKFYRFIQL